MKRILILLSVLLLLASCSSEKEDDSNTFVVGMECDYAPFNWTSNDSSSGIAINEVDYADGYDVRIAMKIADSLGKQLVVKKYDWDSLIVALNNGDIDAVIAGMTDTEERRQAVNFTSPYYESKMVIIVDKDSELVNVNDIQQLSGYKVLGQLNTIYDTCIDQIEGVQHMTPMESYPRMVVALQNGEVDALTAELPVAMAITEANDDLCYVTFDSDKGFDAETSVSIAIAKDNDELLNQVEDALSKISEEERNSIMQEAINDQPTGE